MIGMNWWQAFKLWLMIRWTKRGLPIEIEARHGAVRTRKRLIWTGEMIRVDIPTILKSGVTDTPMGRVSSEDAQKLIDSFTGVEGEDPFNGFRPGKGHGMRVEHGKRVCSACGQEFKAE